jgi:glutaminase
MYFRQCAVLVTAQDLAVMAATLANAGVNPTTGEQVVPREVVAPVLTVMSSCGMYDYAGEWLYRVGLPAKSGVSGGIAAALPGQLGLAAHSPRLDERGNSVRGVAACEALSERLGLHLLLPNERARASARRTYRGDAVRSKRARRASERAVLDRAGRRIVVHELIGDQEFAAVENLVRAVLTDIEGGGWRVLHLRRVTRLDLAAVALLSGLIADLVAGGVQVAIVDPKGHAGRAAAFELGDVPHFGDLDQALEWCEDALLAEHGSAPALPDELVPLSDQDVLADLDPAVLQALESRITTKIFTPGTVVFDEGDASDGLYFIAAGLVAADVKVPGGRKRLSTSGPGSSFGELALIDGRPRSTRIVALEPTMCQVLSQEAFADLGRSDPGACAALTMALARSLSQRLRYSTAEVAALTSA